MKQLETALPHSKESEHALLGAILVGAVGAAVKIDELEWTDFYLPFHQVIFRHLKKLRANSKPTNDAVVLLDSLQVANEVDAAGGHGFIASLGDGIPRISNVGEYTDILKRHAAVRNAIHSAHYGIERLLTANGDAYTVIQEVANSFCPYKGSEFGQKELDVFETAAASSAAGYEKPRFVVEPYVIAGAVTDIVAKIKLGKTTFVLGNCVSKALLKGPVVYLTEQPRASFHVALERASLHHVETLHILYFNAVAGMEWQAIAAVALDKCKAVAAVLLVVDTLSHFAGLEGDSENDSGSAIAAMKPLLAAASEGIAVLTVRHERKSGGDVGDAGRGSSAFGGAADTLLALRRPEGRSRPTLRKIECISRFEGLPDEAVYEYRDGQYHYMGTESDISGREAEEVILAAAPDSEETAKEFDALIEGSQVARTTAQRVIKQLISEKKLTPIGKGIRGSPFRYFLSEKVSAQTPHIYGQKDLDHVPTQENLLQGDES